MTNAETALALAKTAMDLTIAPAKRKDAWVQLTELKRKTKVSYAKLGISADDIRAMLAAMESGEVTEPAAEPAVARSGRKTSDTRRRAADILNTIPDASRADKIKALMNDLQITKFNAAYYVDRVFKTK